MSAIFAKIHTEPTEGAVQKLYTETGENLPPPLIWGSINT